MKAIANVFWIDDGQEKSTSLYDQPSLDSFTKGLKREKVTHWVCMNSLDVKLPRYTKYTPRTDVLQ